VAAQADGTARPMLLGDAGTISETASAAGVSLDGIRVLDLAEVSARRDLVDALVARRKHKGMTPEQAEKDLADPVVAALSVLAAGEADGFVGGAVASTAHVLRWSFGLIGPAPGVKLVSSFFLMLLEQPHHDPHEAVLFSDCALVVEPDAVSFSTAGSARHDRVSAVQSATESVRAAQPSWQVAGDIQFDAAFVPEIFARKAPEQVMDGRTNVFVFPSLEAGNIGYKLAERLGGCTALGPVIQGLAKPVNDLSRGCSAADIEAVMAITSVQAASA